MGLNVPELLPTRRGLARQCLDWSERQHHLAGPLGVQWMSRLCTNGWLRRIKATRAVQVTPQGWVWLKEQLGIEGRLGESGTRRVRRVTATLDTTRSPCSPNTSSNGI
jgi:hypothetical protein